MEEVVKGRILYKRTLFKCQLKVLQKPATHQRQQVMKKTRITQQRVVQVAQLEVGGALQLKGH